ncbi:MAG: two-component system nitrogen regulation sensor histidine kinase NtrY [Myxococcota bacterium]
MAETMKLSSRLTLAFLLVAWIPLGAVVWVLTDRTDTAFRDSFDARVTAVEQAVGRRLETVEKDVDTALARIASLTDWRKELLERLSRGKFYGSDFEKLFVTEGARELMTSPALETLRVVDAKTGVVIAMGHRRAFAADLKDPEAVEVARMHPDRVFFRRERVDLDTGESAQAWTLQGVVLVDDRVVLVGGVRVDEQLLQGLLSDRDETFVALVDATGQRIAATFPGDVPTLEAGYEVAATPFINPGQSEPVAKLTVYIGRSTVARTRGDLWKTAGILGGVSGLVALLAGLLISRRISKPLEGLAEAAADVAAGARDRQVMELKGKDEVARLTRAFNQMTLDLSESESLLRQSERVAAWREIARRIAHEIKNPLFPIQMAIETLVKVHKRKHPDFEEIFEESTVTILEEVARMKRIVTEFSDFARMPAPRRVQTDLVDLASHIVTLMRETKKDVAVTLTGGDTVDVVVDADQIRQALMNLVKNGLEALNPADGGEPARLEVRVEAEPAGGARIVVTDNGPGMDDETLGKLFVPYFTTKAEGTGLGLAIVHRIVAEHEGTIRVDSEVGVGTRFVIRLPESTR